MTTENKVMVVDLDGTLCTQESTGTYHLAKPKHKIIERVNMLWTKGWTIKIFTARGMNSCNGDKARAESIHRESTEKWLKENRVCYDSLEFGKPSADYYLDDKAMTISDFINKPLGSL